MIRFLGLNEIGQEYHEKRVDGREIQIEKNLEIYQRALQLQHEGKLEEAKKLYQEILATSLFPLQDAMEQEEDVVEAVVDLQSSPLHLLRFVVYKNFGLLLSSQGQTDSAELYLQKALGVDPTDSGVWMRLAMLAEKEDDLYYARHCYEQVLQHSIVTMTRLRALCQLSIVLYRLGDVDACFAIVSEALKLSVNWQQGLWIKKQLMESILERGSNNLSSQDLAHYKQLEQMSFPASVIIKKRDVDEVEHVQLEPEVVRLDTETLVGLGERLLQIYKDACMGEKKRKRIGFRKKRNLDSDPMSIPIQIVLATETDEEFSEASEGEDVPLENPDVQMHTPVDTGTPMELEEAQTEAQEEPLESDPKRQKTEVVPRRSVRENKGVARVDKIMQPTVPSGPKFASRDEYYNFFDKVVPGQSLADNADYEYVVAIQNRLVGLLPTKKKTKDVPKTQPLEPSQSQSPEEEQLDPSSLESRPLLMRLLQQCQLKPIGEWIHQYVRHAVHGWPQQGVQGWWLQTKIPPHVLRMLVQMVTVLDHEGIVPERLAAEHALVEHVSNVDVEYLLSLAEMVFDDLKRQRKDSSYPSAVTEVVSWNDATYDPPQDDEWTEARAVFDRAFMQFQRWIAPLPVHNEKLHLRRLPLSRTQEIRLQWLLGRVAHIFKDQGKEARSRFEECKNLLEEHEEIVLMNQCTEQTINLETADLKIHEYETRSHVDATDGLYEQSIKASEKNKEEDDKEGQKKPAAWHEIISLLLPVFTDLQVPEEMQRKILMAKEYVANSASSRRLVLLEYLVTALVKTANTSPEGWQAMVALYGEYLTLLRDAPDFKDCLAKLVRLQGDMIDRLAHPIPPTPDFVRLMQTTIRMTRLLIVSRNTYVKDVPASWKKEMEQEMHRLAKLTANFCARSFVMFYLWTVQNPDRDEGAMSRLLRFLHGEMQTAKMCDADNGRFLKMAVKHFEEQSLTMEAAQCYHCLYGLVVDPWIDVDVHDTEKLPFDASHNQLLELILDRWVEILAKDRLKASEARTAKLNESLDRIAQAVGTQWRGNGMFLRNKDLVDNYLDSNVEVTDFSKSGRYLPVVNIAKEQHARKAAAGYTVEPEGEQETQETQSTQSDREEDVARERAHHLWIPEAVFRLYSIQCRLLWNNFPDRMSDAVARNTKILSLYQEWERSGAFQTQLYLDPTNFDSWWTLGVYYAQWSWFMLETGNGVYLRQHYDQLARLQRRALHCFLQAVRMWQAKKTDNIFPPIKVPANDEAHPPFDNTILAMWVQLAVLSCTIYTGPMKGAALNPKKTSNAMEVWKKRFEQVLNPNVTVPEPEIKDVGQALLSFAYTCIKNAIKLCPTEWIYHQIAGELASRLKKPCDEVIGWLVEAHDIQAKGPERKHKDLRYFLDPQVKILTYLVKGLNSETLTERKVLQTMEKISFFTTTSEPVKDEAGNKLKASKHAKANDLLFTELAALRKSDYKHWYTKAVLKSAWLLHEIYHDSNAAKSLLIGKDGLIKSPQMQRMIHAHHVGAFPPGKEISHAQNIVKLYAKILYDQQDLEGLTQIFVVPISRDKFAYELLDLYAFISQVVGSCTDLMKKMDPIVGNEDKLIAGLPAAFGTSVSRAGYDSNRETVEKKMMTSIGDRLKHSINGSNAKGSSKDEEQWIRFDILRKLWRLKKADHHFRTVYKVYGPVVDDLAVRAYGGMWQKILSPADSGHALSDPRVRANTVVMNAFAMVRESLLKYGGKKGKVEAEGEVGEIDIETAIPDEPLPQEKPLESENLENNAMETDAQPEVGETVEEVQVEDDVSIDLGTETETDA